MNASALPFHLPLSFTLARRRLPVNNKKSFEKLFSVIFYIKEKRRSLSLYPGYPNEELFITTYQPIQKTLLVGVEPFLAHTLRGRVSVISVPDPGRLFMLMLP